MQFRKEIYQLTPYTPGEQPSPNQKIIKLNTNENPYPPSPKALEAGKKILESGLLRKYPNPSSSKLRDAIAQYHQIDSDMVLVTNGSDEAIRLLFHAILKEGDTLAYPEPTYSAYPVFCDITFEKVHKKPVPLNHSFQIDWDRLKTHSPHLIAFANPNAPTGILETIDSIKKFLKDSKGFVLCDEAYIDFAGEGATCIPLIQEFNHLFVTRTFSKSYSLAGLRLGYIVGHPEWIQLLHKIRDSYNVGMIEQEMGIAALEDQEYFKSILNKIIQTRDWFQLELEKLGFFVLPSKSNFLFAKPLKKNASYYYNELKKKGIYVRYFPQGIAQDFIRITIGTPEEMEALKNAIVHLQEESEMLA